MRYALAFGILASGLVVAAVRQMTGAGGLVWVLIVIELYLALSLFTLSAIYGFRHAGRPVEETWMRPGGHGLLPMLLFPYRALGNLILRLASRLGREEAMSLVSPRLYVGRLPFPREFLQLGGSGITTILNLCAEYPPVPSKQPGLTVAHVPILDGTAPTERQFLAALELLARWYAEGQIILIHCAQGHGRSATIAAAALCRLGHAADADEALSLIVAARPGARPSRGQREALSTFLEHRSPILLDPHNP
jgi:hypothetical protein